MGRDYGRWTFNILLIPKNTKIRGMNKKQIQRIKKIIGFNPDLPEHKRLLRRLKKQYIKLPKDKKVDLVGDLKKAFGVEE